MENTEAKSKSTEEVDITQFFKWIGNGFNRVGRGIFYSLALSRKLFVSHILFFAIVIIAGLTLGIIYSRLLQTKYYQSSMVLSCDYLNTQIMENTISKFNNLASEAQGKSLARELNIDEETAKNIQGFEFKAFVSEEDVVEMEILREQLSSVATKKEVVEKVLKQLELESENSYEITVSLYNPNVVKSLEAGLVNYFRNREYIKNRIESRRKNLVDRQSKLARESKKLDSLKAVVFLNLVQLSKSNRGSNNVILNDETLGSPLEVFKEDLKINEELLEIQEDLALQDDFEIIDGFTAFSYPRSANLPKILVISFLLSFFVGYLILGGVYLDRALAKYPLEK